MHASVCIGKGRMHLLMLYVNRCFRTFLEFLFNASVSCIVSKEWTAKVSASCDTYTWSYSARKLEQ